MAHRSSGNTWNGGGGGGGGGGQHAPKSFAQEWIFNNYLLFGNTNFVVKLIGYY